MSHEFPEFPSDRSLLYEIIQNQKKQEKMMSALSDGISAFQASFAKFQTDNAKALSDLQAAVAASGNDSADVAAAVSALSALNTSVQGMDAASIAADPANAPAPTPST